MKQSQLVILGVGAIALIILLFFVQVYKAPAEILGSTQPTGFVELAVSKPNYVSSDSKFNGQSMYSLAIAVNGQGRSAKTTISPNLFSGAGSLPSGEFEIQVDQLEQGYNYDVSESTPPEALYSGSCYTQSYSACNWFFDHGTVIAGNTRACGMCSDKYCWGITWSTSPVYTIANLGQGKTYSKVKITITNYNKTVFETIVSPAQTSTTLGDLGYAYSVGYLLGQLAPPQLDVAFIKPASGGNYSSIAKSGVTIYKSVWASISPQLNYCPSNGCAPTGGCLDAQSQIGSALSTMATSKPMADVNWVCSLSNFTYSCVPSTQALVLTMVLNIKADWLGINVPVGKPEIESLEIQGNLTARQQGQLLLTVKNVGNDAGAFSAYLACPTSLSAFSTTMTIGPNQTSTVTLPINPVKAGTYDCNISVFDQNRPDINATRQVTITVRPPICPDYFFCCASDDPDFQAKLELPPLVNVTMDNETNTYYWDIANKKPFLCNPDYVSYSCSNHQLNMVCTQTIQPSPTPIPIATSTVSIGPQVLTAEQKAQLEAQKAAAPSPWIIGGAIIGAIALAGWWFFLRPKK
jgi:hypothetical protein